MSGARSFGGGEAGAGGRPVDAGTRIGPCPVHDILDKRGNPDWTEAGITIPGKDIGPRRRGGGSCPQHPACARDDAAGEKGLRSRLPSLKRLCYMPRCVRGRQADGGVAFIK